MKSEKRVPKLSHEEKKVLREFVERLDSRKPIEPTSEQEKLLERVKLVMGPEGENVISPDPKIKRLLREKIQKKNRLLKPFELIIVLMKKRIPVYQAAIVAAALSLAFTGWMRADRAQNANGITVYSAGQAVLDTLRTFEHLRFAENQKVGRNIKEDSLLIRFIVTSLP